MIAFVLLTIAVFIGRQWIKKKFSFWTKRGFLQANPSFPLGTLSGVGTKISNAEKLDIYYREFKGKSPVVGIYNFLSPVILVLDPECLKNILVRDFQSFHDRGLYYNKRDDPIGANLLTLDGQDWKDRRAKLTPMFSSGKIKMMYEFSELNSNKFVEILDKEAESPVNLEMREWLQRFTTDNIGNIAFGIEPKCLDDENSEFVKHFKEVTNISLWTIMTVIFGTEWPDLARKLGLRFIPKTAGDFFLNAFIQTITYREKNQVNRNDYVSLLLRLKDVYTKTELAAEAFIAFFGGLETSSTAMTFILYELAIHSEIQQKLREEVTSGINGNDGKLTYELLFSFKYLDMVINEGLRKYPPIATPLRKSTKDYQIPGTDLLIFKGTVILINTYSFQHDEEYFPEPEKFDPERFSDENVRNIKPFTNIPFGDGPRSCIGSRLGLMQTKLGIAKLVKNFKFQPCNKTRIPVKFVPSSPLLAPEGGMWLKIEKV